MSDPQGAVDDVATIKKMYGILGLFGSDPKQYIEQKEDIPQEILQLAESRWQAKRSRDWATADKLRDQLLDLGYVILDQRDGYTIEKK